MDTLTGRLGQGCPGEVRASYNEAQGSVPAEAAPQVHKARHVRRCRRRSLHEGIHLEWGSSHTSLLAEERESGLTSSWVW